MKLLKKNFQPFFSWSNFEDFRILFHYRPIPSLYLKRFKSYSSSKRNTDYLEFFFSYGIVKTFLDYFYSILYYAQTPKDKELFLFDSQSLKIRLFNDAKKFI